MKSLPVLTPLVLVTAALYPAGQALARDLADLLPGLYGGDGITLGPPPRPEIPSHEAHFNVDTSEAINQVNDQIAGEIRPFPVVPSAGGLTYEFDPATGSYSQTSDTLGPLAAERPQTLGRGKFSVGLAYTFFEYDEFEGDDLNDLQSIALHIPETLDPDDERTSFELDVLDITFDLDLKFQTLALTGFYGVTDRLDVGIVVPFVKAELDVDSRAEIVVSPENPFPTAHTFEGAEDSPTDSASGDESGLGDVLLAAKYFWLDEERYDVAVAGRLKLETGDEDNFLGTGSTTFKPFVIAAYDLNPATRLHANVGFEFDFDDSDRDEFNYALGLDAGNQTYTVAADLLGRHKLHGVEVGENIIDGALGLKWRPAENVILSANLIFPLNDDGLRSDLITTLGLEYRN